MKILKIEPLVWKFFIGQVECFVCHKKGSVATWKVWIDHDGVQVNLLACDDCYKLDASEMLARVL